MAIRHDWTVDEALALLTGPLPALLARAEALHREYAAQDVQKCVLLSVKTGGCPEDCGYCSQSARYQTTVEAEALLPVGEVLGKARAAKESGASRFCMGTAWRQVPDDRRLDQVLEMVEGVAALGMEVCCTLGMATESQLVRLREAGLTAYNHNLDTSREHYPQITTTRTYDDRLETLRAARRAGVQVCCGGILGMGESLRDRAALLVELATLEPHPESVPVNLLVPIAGTPLQTATPVPFDEFLRMIASARVMLPRSRVRLSAGRNQLTQDQQLACFRVGANSIFAGDRLLTTSNVPWSDDEQLYGKIPPTAL